MKRVTINPFMVSVFLYRPDKKARFEKEYSVVLREDDGGMASGNGAWVDGSDESYCYHEAVHLADWIIQEHLKVAADNLWGTTELRAYLSQYIGKKFAEYVRKP